MMSDALAFSPAATIAAKDIRDAVRDRFVLIVTLFLTLGAVVALVTGAIALRTDAATYEAAKATLLALGKPVDQIAAPEFYPLKLLRGAVEQIGIVGAAIAILIGYRAAASERGRQTLALILTRPVRRWQFLAGKAVAGLSLLGFYHSHPDHPAVPFPRDVPLHSAAALRAVNAIELARAGTIVILRHNKPVDPEKFRGVYRLRTRLPGDPTSFETAVEDDGADDDI